jgi:hypothetical protein
MEALNPILFDHGVEFPNWQIQNAARMCRAQAIAPFNGSYGVTSPVRRGWLITGAGGMDLRQSRIHLDP